MAPCTCEVWPSDLNVAVTGTTTQNEYEQQRQRNMARNAEMLHALLDKAGGS